jgi:hypothetical protein
VGKKFFFYLIKISNRISIGPQFACYDYGHLCYERDRIKRGIWFFYIIAFINVLFESLNILFLCRQTRSRINLILGKCNQKKIC